MRVVAALLMVSLLAGCLNDFDDEALLNNYLTIQTIDVAAPEVRSGSMQLVVNTTLDNEMARSGDVSVRVKAFNTQTGLLEQTRSTSVGVIGAEKTTTATTTLDLPRANGYRLEVNVIQNEQVIQVRTVTMNNLQTLAPNVHETGISISGMDFFVENATGDRALITAALHVTNEGASESRPLRVQVKAREVTTGLIADETWIEVPAIPPEETHPREAMLDVPQDFNYEVEAVVWDDNFIVGRDHGNVQLLPTFTVPKDSEVKVVETDIGRFEREPDGSFADDEASAPGPAVWAILIMIGGIVWMKRRN